MRRIVLADLPRVGVEMHEPHVWRHRLGRRRQRPGEEIAADREEHVVRVERFSHRRLQARHGAAKERMGGRKGRTARHELGNNRRAQQLGELDQLGMGAALRHHVARDDHRMLRVREQIGGGRDRVGIAAQARRDAGRRHQVDLALVLEDVAGQREKHRAGGRRERGLRGAVHEARQVGEAAHLVGPFHERPRQGRQVGGEDRLGDDVLGILLAGGEEDGRGCLLRVVEHAHGVAEPGRDVEVEHRELAGGLRIAVGHRHQRRLLQAEHVFELVLDRERIHQRQLGGAGIAEHDLHAFLLEQFEEGAFSGHGAQGCLLGEVFPRIVTRRVG